MGMKHHSPGARRRARSSAGALTTWLTHSAGSVFSNASLMALELGQMQSRRVFAATPRAGRMTVFRSNVDAFPVARQQAPFPI